MKNAIICVDDERVIIMSVMEQLWDHFGDKYVYEMAMSGEEALEIITELVIDGTKVILIISDWLMSGMKGDELIISIHKKYPTVQTILLTGQAEPEAIRNAKENGALNAVISKPWDKDVLMNTISGLVENGNA